MSDKIEVRNVNAPHHVTRVNRAKYEAVLAALQIVVPRANPGITPSEVTALAKPHLPQDLFPKGATSGWWVKTVHLDLESKGEMSRLIKPVRIWWTT